MFLNLKSLVLAGMRGFTLVAKLAFTIVLARWLSVEEFGQWVLIVAVVTYGIFLVGAELYNLSLRTYVREGYDAVVPVFSAQWSYYAITYATMIALALVMPYLGEGALYANTLIIALILILEHSSHELHRLAFFRDDQIHANMILVIKSAGWMIPTAAFLAYDPASASLSLVLKAWLAGALLAAVYAFVIYRGIFRGLRFHYLRRIGGQFNRAVGLVTPFLVIAVAMRTPFLFDRYLIERFAGASELGPYGYYATFGFGVQSIFDVVILARLMPRLLGEKHAHAEHTKIVFFFLYQTIFFWLISLVAIGIVLPYVNGFTGKENFQDAFGLFVLLSVGQMVFAMASVMHYGLYALHRDRQLANGAVIYLVVVLALYFAMIPLWGAYGAAAALLAANIGFFGLRTYQLLRDEPPAAPVVQGS